MREADECRRRATFCVTFAATVDDPTAKASLIEMGEKWRGLADGLDFAEPPPSPNGCSITDTKAKQG